MTKYSITNSQTQRFLGVYRATCVTNAIDDQGAWEKRTRHLRYEVGA